METLVEGGYRQLIERADPEALRELKERLDAEKEGGVRAAVAELLKSVSHPEALSLLVGLAKDPDVRVRVAALRSLEGRPEGDAAAVVLAMMFDGDPQVSRRAERAAMAMGKERLVGLIGDMVKSDRPWKMKAGVRAAGRINSRQMVPILEGAYLFGDEKTQERALESLEALSARGNPAATELLERIRLETGRSAAPAKAPPPLAESDEMPLPPMGARIALDKIRSLEDDEPAPPPGPPDPKGYSGSGHRIPLGSLGADEPVTPDEPDEIMLQPVAEQEEPEPGPPRKPASRRTGMSAFNQAGPSASPPAPRPDLRKRDDAPRRPELKKRGTGLDRPAGDPGDPGGGLIEPGKVAMRVCPMCAEEIPRSSVKCELCGEVLSRPAGKGFDGPEETADWRLRMVSSMADSFAAGIINIIPLYIPGLAYLLFKDSFSGGQSPGKQANDLRVIDDATGAPCTPGQSFLRNLVLLVPGVAIIELIFVIASGRRVGDRLAGTRVIRPRSAPPPRWFLNYFVIFFFVGLPAVAMFAAVGIGVTAGLGGFTTDGGKAEVRYCYANQKTLMGAIEMYRLDNGDKVPPVTEITPELMQALVEKGYLQSIPEDPGAGAGSVTNYQLIQAEPIAIGCSRHGSVMSPTR